MLHPHRAPVLQFWLQARVFGRRQETKLWTALPMFWTAGMNTAMGATLAAGGCWVMQESFEPGAALRLMARERVTEPLHPAPSAAGRAEEHPDWLATDLSSLRCVYGKSAFARHPTVTGDPVGTCPWPTACRRPAPFSLTSAACPASCSKAEHAAPAPGNRWVIDPESGRIAGPRSERRAGHRRARP